MSYDISGKLLARAATLAAGLAAETARRERAAAYRALDEREQFLKTELEQVRTRKQAIAVAVLTEEAIAA